MSAIRAYNRLLGQTGVVIDGWTMYNNATGQGSGRGGFLFKSLHGHLQSHIIVDKAPVMLGLPRAILAGSVGDQCDGGFVMAKNSKKSRKSDLKLGEAEFSQFGNTVIKRTYCPRCECSAFLIGGELKCCGLRIGDMPANTIKVVSESNARKRRPSTRDQVRILEDQGNRCFYCAEPFGNTYYQHGEKIIVTYVCWDHYLPYTYSRNNHDTNFVAACQVCNSIKSNLIFDTIEDVTRYIRKRRTELGYAVVK